MTTDKHLVNAKKPHYQRGAFFTYRTLLSIS